MPKTTSAPTSPVQKYSRLHCVIESGQADDSTWHQLIRVCINLGKEHEALDALEHIQSPALRLRVRRDIS